MSFARLFTAVFLGVFTALAAALILAQIIWAPFANLRTQPAAGPSPRVVDNAAAADAIERHHAFRQRQRFEQLREAERDFARDETHPANEPSFVGIASPVQIDEYTVLQAGTVVRVLHADGSGGLTIGYDGASYDVRVTQTDLPERMRAAAAEAFEQSQPLTAEPHAIEVGLESSGVFEIFGAAVGISNHSQAEILVHH